MDLLPSPEQNEIIDSSAAFLGSRAPVARTRELFESGHLPAIDAAAWDGAAELGWFGLGLPEAFGGVGCGLADEALLFREIGRAGAPGPFLSTVLAARVAAFAGRTELADAIVGGRAVGLAVPSNDSSFGPDGSVHGPILLLDADPEEADSLVLVLTPLVAALVECTALQDVTEVPCLDPASRLHRATGVGAAPSVVVASSVDPIERRGQVLAAAVLTGITEWARNTASEHAVNRVQFDKPIGVNQAIKHPCADMAVQAQLAYAQVLFAALATDEARPDAEFHALTALLTAAGAAETATGATVQVLGGMGFTHEHDVHLYLKRAEIWALVFGPASVRLARLLDLPEPQ